MNTEALLQRAEDWNALADDIEQWAGEDAAQPVRTASEKFEDAVDEWANEPLPIDRAAEESGYSKERLRELIREETIPDAGPDGGRRIRRKHLPRRPGHGVRTGTGSRDSSASVGSRMEDARSVVESD